MIAFIAAWSAVYLLTLRADWARGYADRCLAAAVGRLIPSPWVGSEGNG